LKALWSVSYRPLLPVPLLRDRYRRRVKLQYVNYQTLKSNVPDLLNHVKKIDLSKELWMYRLRFEILRFSYGENGFLSGETFIHYLNTDDYYQLGIAFGGHGVTEFIYQVGDAGSWLYYIFSCGSGIHTTEVHALETFKKDFYRYNVSEIESNKDYTFVLDDSHSGKFGLYEATIEPLYDEQRFPIYSITQGKEVRLSFRKTDKTKIN